MLTNVAQIIKLGNLPDDGDEERIIEYLSEAERQLRDKIGTALYDSIESDDFYAADKIKLARAEAFLTLSELLPVLNLRINPNDGGVVRSVGFGESKNGLASAEEMQQISEMFANKAEAIIAEYVPVDDDESDEIGGDENMGWFSV